MIKKKTPVNKIILVYFTILLGATILCMLLFGSYSLWTYIKHIRHSNRAALEVYAYELKSVMSNLESFNQDTYTNNYNFQVLAMGNYTPAEKVVHEYYIRNSLKNRVPSSGAIFVFDNVDDISIYRFGSKFPSKDILSFYKLKDHIINYWTTADQSEFFNWKLYHEDSYSLLMNTYKLDDLYVCSMIDLDRFVIQDFSSSYNNDLIFAFYNDEQFLTNKELLNHLGVTVEDVKKSEKSTQLLPINYLIETKPIDNSNVNIVSIMPSQYWWTSIRVFVFLIVLILVILCGIILVVFTNILEKMINPLKSIASKSEQLEQNEEALILDNSNTMEIHKISTALNNLFEQKINLEKEKREKELEKDHALLQYFQLQTRSHFYLNCLKSLYNMSESKDYERMQKMILAFSNHLRYIFNDTLKLVTLKAELYEVKDYYDIIVMDRLKPIILSHNIKEELLNCMVPPLIIQTFLENSYKHNGKNEKTLQFSIQIDKVELNDKPYIRIRLSDNGVGYSKEMLDKLNNDNDNTFESYQIGISNLKKRIQLIYHTNYQIAFFNQASGGACTLICLPMLTEENTKGEV